MLAAGQSVSSNTKLSLDIFALSIGPTSKTSSKGTLCLLTPKLQLLIHWRPPPTSKVNRWSTTIWTNSETSLRTLDTPTPRLSWSSSDEALTIKSRLPWQGWQQADPPTQSQRPGSTSPSRWTRTTQQTRPFTPRIGDAQVTSL